MWGCASVYVIFSDMSGTYLFKKKKITVFILQCILPLLIITVLKRFDDEDDDIKYHSFTDVS